MLTANIKAQSMNLLNSSRTAKTTGENSKSSKTSFDDYMSSPGNDKSYVKADEMSTKDKKSISDFNDKIISQNKAEKLDPADHVVKTLPEVQADDVVIVEDESDDITAMLENMASMMSALQETITQTLGISKDTLNQAMEELGFDSTDLLNNDNLKQLVLYLNNSQDMTELLTDESLGNSLQNLLETVNQFKISNNLSEEKIVSYEQLNNQATVTINEVIQIDDNADASTEPKVIVIKEEVKPVQSDNESSGYKQENTSDDKGRDTQSLTPAEVFIQNLVARPAQETGFTEQIANIRQMQAITNQIVEQIKITINPSQTAMELQLNPENLGKVNLSVIYKDGVMTAHFTAQNEAVKEAIESQMQVLKDNFSNQGLKVESVEVTVSNFTFKDQTSDNTGKESEQPSQRNRHFRTVEDISQNEDPAAVSLGILDDNTNSVDIIA
ncbi:MAG: flagellar hook-length control protein [Anaerocolumna sp.]|jgi:flagellar hook-length control protein FliK|nr:flagellar hook-length control protein [Anaerocolumna sp.]